MKVSAVVKAAILASVASSAVVAGSAHADALYNSTELRAVETAIPEYPRRAELSGVEGFTVVEFTVMPDGTVAEPAIKQSSYRLFSRAALAAIEEWKFEPVVAEAGEAIPVRSAMRFNFVGAE